MQRPDLDPLAWVHPACPQLRLTGQGHLTVRTVYGQDGLRLLRGRLCGEECSERRGTALFKTKGTEATAEALLEHLGAGGGGRATARVSTVAQETVARLLRRAGRYAERVQDQRVRAVTPRAVACAASWSCVNKSRSVVRPRSAPRQGTGGPYGDRRG